ncbi:Glycerophosphoryl diester phosphodiesterase [Poriferisphaera corsica]|uniref:Glycerophosphoryl diester phosphodiesterase n=1 Tax=Poriferisphaera corsica TaxID=2528020 RepID=A0A517YX45_9BACT|nr:glycerophosphodiester phosphodiesterase [Poriferisphaera corsica]QDU34792.1 Glycerophosphoryl diester phosphodiesterase [Poriferisphaera corsica]
MEHPIKRVAMLFVMLAVCVAFVFVAFNLAEGQGGKHVPLIVGHRGASYDAPENTVASYKQAWEQGADAVETDVYVTKDGQLVCLHDNNLDRTGGVRMDVRNAELDAIKQVEVGSYKGEQYRGEKVPTLVEVLETVPEGKLLYVEIKKDQDVVRAVRLVKEDIEKVGIDPDQIRVISFEPVAVKSSKEQMPDVEAYLLIDFKQNEQTGMWWPTAEETIRMLKSCDANGVDMSVKHRVDQAYIDRIKDAGYSYHIWTVNSPHLARIYAEMGVDSITTDRPAFIRQAIEGEATKMIPLEPSMPAQGGDVPEMESQERVK